MLNNIKCRSLQVWAENFSLEGRSTYLPIYLPTHPSIHPSNPIHPPTYLPTYRSTLWLTLKTYVMKPYHTCNYNIREHDSTSIFPSWQLVGLHIKLTLAEKEKRFPNSYVFYFIFLKLQLTSNQSVAVANFGWRMNHVKRLISSCLQNLCSLNFDLWVPLGVLLDPLH